MPGQNNFDRSREVVISCLVMVVGHLLCLRNNIKSRIKK